MDTDTLIILIIVAIFALYINVLSKRAEKFETNIKLPENTPLPEANFSPLPQEDEAPCYLVKSLTNNDTHKTISTINADVFEKEANFDSEYTNLNDYFGNNAVTVPQKKYYESVSNEDIVKCGAPVLEKAEYSSSAF